MHGPSFHRSPTTNTAGGLQLILNFSEQGGIGCHIIGSLPGTGGGQKTQYRHAYDRRRRME
jgi:hypothetical protein